MELPYGGMYVIIYVYLPDHTHTKRADTGTYIDGLVRREAYMVSIYIYIYLERERERERERCTKIYIHTYVHKYIHMCVYRYTYIHSVLILVYTTIDRLFVTTGALWFPYADVCRMHRMLTYASVWRVP